MQDDGAPRPASIDRPPFSQNPNRKIFGTQSTKHHSHNQPTMNFFSKKALAAAVGQGSGLGFGCMGITAFYGASMADDAALKLLQAVYDAGCRHFDTAEVYATKEKHNEDILGDFFKTVPRDSFTVATKYWPQDGQYDYKRVKTSLQASLKRLQLDYVDLYYAHRVTSLEGGLQFGATAKRLKEEGLIKEVGLSEVNGVWLRQIHAVTPIAAVQQEWSLMTRSLEAELVPACAALGVTIVAYSPLARNLLASTTLTQAPDDWRATTVPRYAAENLAHNQKVTAQVHALAEKYDATAAQLSLAWLFHKAAALGVSVVPIPGSTKMAHATGNLGATKIRISDADLVVLEGLAVEVAGDRGTEGYMSMTMEGQVEK
jgi:aryl-alcohol dehydrogenase-like predicted oxidoreductase